MSNAENLARVALALTADASKNLTGTTTPPLDDNTKKLATTEFMLQQFTGSGKQLTTQNGYQKLPGGLVLQWGLKTVAAGNTTVTLPVAFGTAMFLATATQSSPYGGGLTVNNIITVSNFTTANFNIASNVPGGVYWFAIGI